jgi:Filamin/ABP280 repeat
MHDCYTVNDFSSDLDIDIEDNGDDTFSIYYTVKDAGDYTLNVKFGGQPVPNGFYTFTVSTPNTNHRFPPRDLTLAAHFDKAPTNIREEMMLFSSARQLKMCSKAL